MLAANAIDVTNERDAITTGFPTEIIKKSNPDALHCRHFELAVTGKRGLIQHVLGVFVCREPLSSRVQHALF